MGSARVTAFMNDTLSLEPRPESLLERSRPAAARLAEIGLCVTGVDYSRRSIDYATQYAREHSLDVSYRYQDYLTLDDESQYDVALLIYGDLCPLASEKRACLLQKVHHALKANGHFVLDVSKRELRKRDDTSNTWYTAGSGFWKPVPHLVLEQRFDYPEDFVHLDQYIVIESDGTFTVYRTWRQEYTQETITSELEANGFRVQSLWGDLAGAPCTKDTEWIGVVAQKA